MQISRREVVRLGVLGGVTAGLVLTRPGSAGGLTPPSRTFSGNNVLSNGFTVPPGAVWAFDPQASTTVVVNKNVIVQGTLVMRPGRPDVVHTLRFEGVDEAAFVGGHSTGPLATDVGLWVTGAGRLDAQGAPKMGWNRTGDDPTWSPADELIVAPSARGDFTGFKAFKKGGSVPFQTGPDGTRYPTEVANLTRNVRIEGTAAGRAHIMFHHCQTPQTIRFVEIRHMGPQQETGETYRSGTDRRPVYEGVLGRYGLHFHGCGDGSRGSLIEGVVVRNTGGRAFVPHASHGITFRNCVAHDIRTSGFWWDAGDETHEATFDRCAVLGLPRNPGDTGLRLDGFLHNLGSGNVTRGCVAVGVLSSSVNSGAYNWPSAANHGNNLWTWEDNLAHNNAGAGIAVWQNDANSHKILRYVGYNNDIGISHGAYQNTYTYQDAVTFGNRVELVQLALGSITFERAKFDGDILIAHHSLASSQISRYINCRVSGIVRVAESRNGGVIQFYSTSPSCDIGSTRFSRVKVLSKISVRNSNGASYQVL